MWKLTCKGAGPSGGVGAGLRSGGAAATFGANTGEPPKQNIKIKHTKTWFICSLVYNISSPMWWKGAEVRLSLSQSQCSQTYVWDSYADNTTGNIVL